MFLNIDQKNPADIAAIDDHEDSLTYGELVRFCDHFGEVLDKRTLIFILSENCIGAFAGYIGALSNKIVPLIIHSHTESGLFQNLLAAYRPEYLWLPERLGHEYGSEVIFGFKHYILVKTGMTPPPLYKELSLLLPTSGSTGSSKLVRHSYKNVEANARNVSLLFGLDKHERALAALPIYYTMGLSVISSHIYAGATILLTGKSLTDGKFWTFMKEHRATSFTGVPYSFEVLQKLRFFRMELPHLQLITQGGGKMDEKLFRTCADYAEKNGKKFIRTRTGTGQVIFGLDYPFTFI